MTKAKNKAPRPVRVNRVGRKLARRAEKRKSKNPREWGGKPLRRKEFRLRRRLMIAYDLETTRIKANETPAPLYLTAYSEVFECSTRVTSEAQLSLLITERFLVPEFNRCRFVAWNGNNFDVYIVARALLLSSAYTVRPYLTRSKNLRGLRVLAKDKWLDPKTGKLKLLSWEFLDGISMTGSVGVPLKSHKDKSTGKMVPGFLKQFAPEYDWQGGPDFESGEDFDYRNPEHVRYAERDSEGLYHAMQKVESIVAEHFGMALQPTIGNLGIKLFQMNMPEGVTVWKPPYAALAAIRNTVMRGGYCWRARRFEGPIWKYDLNQAYAAAMRECKLPAGRMLWSPPVAWHKLGDRKAAISPYASVYIARVRGVHPANTVPFYCRDMEGAPVFAVQEIPETWLTSIEVKQLRDEGARLEVLESYYWDEHFKMTEYVDMLERLRMSADGGPSGPLGQVVKYIGNNSFGKTVERLDGIELVMALDCPEGYNHYQSENDKLQCVWYRFAEPVMREYHQPQLGAFVTAHPRMVLRRGILTMPENWLYADTDCLAFDVPNPHLPIDPKKYGLWKIEKSGADYYVIEKKVYAAKDGSERRAKGMNVRRLTAEDFKEWHAGRPPVQVQTQRNNFVAFMSGGDMFKEQKKTGQVIGRAKPKSGVFAATV